MENIGLQWMILYLEIFFLICLMGYWLGYCFDKIISAIRDAAMTDSNVLYAISASMERIESEIADR